MQYPGDCPECGEELAIRTARKGSRQGQRFWGCTGWRKSGCRFTINIHEDEHIEDVYEWSHAELREEVILLREENARLRRQSQAERKSYEYSSSNNGKVSADIKRLLTTLLTELHQDRWSRFGDAAADQAKTMTQMIIKQREKL